MTKPVGPLLVICLLAATSAHAQYGGGYGGHRHGGGGGSSSAPSGSGSSSAPAAKTKPTPVSDSDIIGVITAIDPASNRITIAYDAVQARNWPPGTMPFVVSKPSLLTGASVGEKVRFRLDSEQIIELQPY